MCTHFFRLTTVRLCACGLMPCKREGAIQVNGAEDSPLRFFKLRCRCGRPCDFFHFYVLVYPSRGVVHFFYYRSEFQSRFCRVGLKAGERRFVLHFCWREWPVWLAGTLSSPAFCANTCLESPCYCTLQVAWCERDSAPSRVDYPHLYRII